MSKISLIISREYLSRVKKKSFLIMTLITPLLFAAIMIAPAYLASKGEKQMKVLVVDDNNYFINSFQDDATAQFSYLSGNIDEIKQQALTDGKYDVVIHILKSTLSLKTNVYYYDEPTLTFKDNIEDQMDKLLFDKLLQDTFNISPKIFDVYKQAAKTHLTMIQTDKSGNDKESFSTTNRIVGLVAGIIIYFFIFMFASMVLRGVLEEKSSRIVEVILSSVKPIQLMMGKIVGIAMVGLTQFVIWIILTFSIVAAVTISPDIFVKLSSSNANTEVIANATTLLNSHAIENSENQMSIVSSFFTFNIAELIIAFLFYFIFGYLLYSALFAAVGGLVDNETDSNQFVMPISLPLLLSIIMSMNIVNNPNGSLAIWLSMIPFTSPVAMLMRLPSGVPLWELVTSILLLISCFLVCVWISAKIYKTGILLYGTKTSYKELWKWIKM